MVVSDEGVQIQAGDALNPRNGRRAVTRAGAVKQFSSTNQLLSILIIRQNALRKQCFFRKYCYRFARFGLRCNQFTNEGEANTTVTNDTWSGLAIER
jgi:hypothetical protein